jgi:tetratricopeptide (TPR) repeat protein
MRAFSIQLNHVLLPTPHRLIAPEGRSKSTDGRGRIRSSLSSLFSLTASAQRFQVGLRRIISNTTSVFRSSAVKILFLAANPVDVVTRLRIDREIREIRQKLRRSTLGNQFQLESEWAVRVDDLQEFLMRHKPDIVHFSGHCSPSSGIMLEDENGKRKIVSREALAELFRILKGNIKVVVLNACYAKDQAQALATAIDFTIGMNAEIDDKDATIFAAHFYQSLGFGYSVKEAFDLAVNQLQLVGSDGAHVPELVARDGANAVESRIGEPGRRAVVEIQPTVIPAHDAPTLSTQVMRGVTIEEHKATSRPLAFLPWLFASVAIALTTEILRRFLRDGWPDIAALIVQSVFVVVAVGLGAVTIISMMSPTHPFAVRARYSPQKVRRAIILTAILVVIVLILWLSLPVFARYYNERGARFQYRDDPDLTRARESYQQAVRLQPAYAQAHYNLAFILEDLERDKAVEEYLLAIRYDSHIYPAYNNLARLYLRRGEHGDYEIALNLLSQAAALAPQDEKVQYSLNKNLGWANYALKNYQLAETYLRTAIEVRAEQGPAAAHCLLAYVLREQGRDAIEECFDCVSLAPGEKDVETRWVSDAQECLIKGGRK